MRWPSDPGRGDIGKLDNTLVIYISGDNGTSAEGTHRHAVRPCRDPRRQRSRRSQLKFYDVWGSRRRTRTCRSRGPGHSTRRSNGPSRWRRTSAARGRAWRCVAHRIKDAAASARSSTT
jgi:hypothetical protein